MGEGPGKLVLTLTPKTPAPCRTILTRIAGAGFSGRDKRTLSPWGGPERDHAPSSPPSTPWPPSPSPAGVGIPLHRSPCSVLTVPLPLTLPTRLSAGLGAAGGLRSPHPDPAGITKLHTFFAATGSGLGGRQGGEGGERHGQRAAWKFGWWGGAVGEGPTGREGRRWAGEGGLERLQTDRQTAGQTAVEPVGCCAGGRIRGIQPR